MLIIELKNVFKKKLYYLNLDDLERIKKLIESKQYNSKNLLINKTQITEYEKTKKQNPSNE